jgi:undecaprenyl-diphosphatase
MTILQILLLAVIQGLAEMLPVSSSAHVIVAQKLMGLDPSAPELTFLLVMLHTGTMFAALGYFGRRWLGRLKEKSFIKALILATIATGILGLGLKRVIEKSVQSGEVESLFNNFPLIGSALLVAGILIIISGRVSRRSNKGAGSLSTAQALQIGLSQGLCLPFRGLSRSGTTISVGLLTGVGRELAEEFSFALAVLLTPPVVLLELKRMVKALHADPARAAQFSWSHALAPGLIGMAFSFVAGLLALRLLTQMLEKGRWDFFGYYCIAFSAMIFAGIQIGLL